MVGMKSYRQDDIKYLKKAKRRILSASILVYLMICLFFFAAWFILNQPFLPQPENLSMIYVGSTAVTSIVWLIVLFCIDAGGSWVKTVYYLAAAAQGCFAGWLLYQVYLLPDTWLIWLIWGLLMMMETALLFRFGHWLFTSWYGRIYFDRHLILPDSERDYSAGSFRDSYDEPIHAQAAPARRAAPSRPAEPSIDRTRIYQGNPAGSSERIPDFSGSYENSASSVSGHYAQNRYGSDSRLSQADYSGGYSGPDYDSRYADYADEDSGYYEEDDAYTGSSFRDHLDDLADRLGRIPGLAGIFILKHQELNYPRAAIRLGVTVYLEMILFPVLTEIFGFLFKSGNGQYSFATATMFTLCIISAVIWTIPVFFLYLKQTGVKAVIVLCAAAEILISIFYVFVLKGYNSGANPDVHYADSVYLWFGIFDALRYLILIWALVPILRLPSIRKNSTPQDSSGNQVPVYVEDDENGDPVIWIGAEDDDDRFL